ncbi:hypothetical protein ACFSTC_28930 [Nonomuraea ferruginea]
MTDFSVVRRVAPGRTSAVLVLLLLVLSGCGFAGGETGGAETAPAPVTSHTTSESAPAQAESAPAQEANDEPSTAVEPGGTLTDGSTVSAELTRAGQKDKFTLDLGDAKEFYVADMQGADIQLQVFSEVDGEPLGPSSVAMSFGTSLFKLTKVGGHRLEVWGEHERHRRVQLPDRDREGPHLPRGGRPADRRGQP